jgi:hypothetical protein
MVFRKKDQTVQLNNRVKVHYERPSIVNHTTKPITKSISGVSIKPNTIKPSIKKAKIVEAKLKPVEHKKQQVITKRLRSKK